MVREVEQQLLLYNIFISHQLAALQVRPEEIVQSGEVAAGRWQMERGSMVISIFPTRGLAEGDHVLVLNLTLSETFIYWTKNLSVLNPFILRAGPTFGRSCQQFIIGPTDHSILD